MAGSKPSFDATRFRKNIRYVFEMGAHPDTDRQLTFHFPEVITYTGTGDGDDVPFDPTSTVERTRRAPVRRPCDFEYVNAADEPTAFGVVLPTRLKVTLLDEDYEIVKDAAYVIIDGDKYLRHHESPPTGLFNVGLHEIIFAAENDR